MAQRVHQIVCDRKKREHKKAAHAITGQKRDTMKTSNQTTANQTKVIPTLTSPVKPVAMTLEEQINALKAENQALKNKASAVKSHGFSLRVSAKGAISVYGMGRFPVTLYASQWESLFGLVDTIKQFIIDNQAKLAVRPTNEEESK